MNHCKKCGNNIPDHVNDCDEAGFGEDCGNKIATTPTVEEIVEEFEQNLVCYSPKIVSGAGGFYCGHKNGVELYDIDAMLNWLRTTLTTRQQAYEEGVKAGRERIAKWLHEHATDSANMFVSDAVSAGDLLTNLQAQSDNTK